MISPVTRRCAFLVVLLSVAFGTPSAIRAQTAHDREVGPRAHSSAVTWGIQVDVPTFAAPQSRPHAGKDVAMMGAGAAAIVVGALIGGDGGMVLALGGGVVAVIGLYRYLR